MLEQDDRARRRRLRVYGAALVAAGALAFAACGDAPDSEETTAEAGGGDDGIQLAFFGIKGNTYDQASVEAGQAVADEAGATTEVFDIGFDPSKQFNLIQDATTSGKYDGFVLDPLDAASLRPALEEAMDAGIAIGTFDLPSGPDPSTADVQIPGIAGAVTKPATVDGEDAADAIEGACKGKDPCQVAYIYGDKAIQADQQRFDVVDQRAQASDGAIEIVAEGEGGYLADPALKVTQNMLQANPDIDVIATGGDQMAIGAEQAVEDAGLTGQVAIIGAGASRLGLAAVEDGRWYATTLYLPADEGRRATELVIDKINGEDVSEGIDAMDLRGETPQVLSTDNQDEWADFEPQWEG